MRCPLIVFFFSSRRRHTRYIGDWSSDVCSSDLRRSGSRRRSTVPSGSGQTRERQTQRPATGLRVGRSEERRVGKECRSRWWGFHLKKKEKLCESRSTSS